MKYAVMCLWKKSYKMMNYGIIKLVLGYKEEMLDMGDKSPRDKEKKKKKAEKKAAATVAPTILSHKSE